MKEERYTLKIDSEFRRLVLPYRQDEYLALERQILSSGCCEPVVVWYGYIIQGFEQYEICMAHDIAVKIKNISFRVREEVISISCREELSTRCLPENQCRYLIGKCYNAEVVIGAHNAAGTDQFKERNRRELSKGKKRYEGSASLTKKRFAEEYHLDRGSITRYSIYAQAIDYIASVNHEMTDRILMGEMKTSMEAVMACYGKSEDEVTKLLTAPRRSMSAKRPVSVAEKMVKESTIKDMPVFDPDAEINSLALTIPSWVSSIDRTRTTANYSLLTQKGRDQLEVELYKLEKEIQTMLRALKEVH